MLFCDCKVAPIKQAFTLCRTYKATNVVAERCQSIDNPPVSFSLIVASQAADIQQVQAQMIQSLDQIQSVSIEIASMNTKMDFLNTDRIAKDQQIQNLLSASRQLSDELRRTASSASMSRGRDTEIKLVEMKGMSSKKFDSKFDTSFRAWAKAARAYCNASRPGFSSLKFF